MSTLASKLATIYADVDRFQKTKAVTGSGPSYKYVPVEEIADYLRSRLGALGVVMVPTSVEVVASEDAGTTKSGTTRWRHVINMTWTITDGEQSLTVASVGESMDTGDKGMNKAQTAARKYALINAFQLSTGDDPDRSHPEPVVSTAALVNELVEIAGDAEALYTAMKSNGIKSVALADPRVYAKAQTIARGIKGAQGAASGDGAPAPSRREPDDPEPPAGKPAPAGQTSLGGSL